jgi:hypothetical protein
LAGPRPEYDLDPYRIEHQAQVIVHAPLFMKLLEEFLQHVEQEPENLSDDMTKLAQICPPRPQRSHRLARA